MSHREHPLSSCNCLLCSTWRRVGDLLSIDRGPYFSGRALALVRGLETDLLDAAQGAALYSGPPPVAVGVRPPFGQPLGWAVPPGQFGPLTPGGPERFDKGPRSTPEAEGESSGAAAKVPSEEGPREDKEAKGSTKSPERDTHVKKKEKKTKESKKEKRSPDSRRKKKKKKSKSEEKVAKDPTPEARERKEDPAEEVRKTEKSATPEAREKIQVKEEQVSASSEEAEEEEAKTPEDRGSIPADPKESGEGPAEEIDRSEVKEGRGPVLRSVSRGTGRDREKEQKRHSGAASSRSSGSRPVFRSDHHYPREPSHPPPSHRGRSPVRPPGRFHHQGDWRDNRWWSDWSKSKGKNKRERQGSINLYGFDPDKKKSRVEGGR